MSTMIANDLDRPVAAGALTPTMLNHAAFVTHDTEATVRFYTQVMGMELASTVIDDRVPSTGDPFPFLHLFFRMRDGSTVAFFESPGLPPAPPSSHAAYDVFNHFAFQADTVEEVHRWKAWLEKNGVAVRGPIDHEGMFLSIYFHDPNGLRLEVTRPLEEGWNRHTEKGHRDIAQWLSLKEQARREGRDPKQVILEWIRSTRKTGA
jgi:catechol 2,3-dioxygenase-like lactoylglutathione lyase family enzyme